MVREGITWVLVPLLLLVAAVKFTALYALHCTVSTVLTGKN
jgi:hypothetical protein